MMSVKCISMNINQTKHAFRVNGVTIAKRHLAKTFGKDTPSGDFEQMLHKYLVIVPFLHQAFNLGPSDGPSVRYGALKAHRIYEATGLDGESNVPFMLVNLMQAGYDGSLEALRDFGPEAARAFTGNQPSPFQKRERGDNVISFADAKDHLRGRTLH